MDKRNPKAVRVSDDDSVNSFIPETDDQRQKNPSEGTANGQLTEQRQEGPRKWWIELKNMCAWNMDEKPAPHRECVHVIEHSAYQSKCEELAKFAYEEGLRFGEVVKQLIAAKAEIAELKKLTEGMVSSKPPYLEKYEAERARVTRLRSALEKITHDHECMECCMVAFEALKQDGGE